MDAKGYMENELLEAEELSKYMDEYSDTIKECLDEVNTAYGKVFDAINKKEEQLCGR